MAREAKVLRLLRADARAWWYFATLRNQGRVEEARTLERKSIRDQVRWFRENLGRNAVTFRTSCIWFEDRPAQYRPFDLTIEREGHGYSTSASNVHPGEFAAWV